MSVVAGLPADIEAEIEQKIQNSIAKTRHMFLGNYGERIPVDKPSSTLRIGAKIRDEYSEVKDMPPPHPLVKVDGPAEKKAPASQQAAPPKRKAPQAVDKVSIEDVVEDDSHGTAVLGDLVEVAAEKLSRTQQAAQQQSSRINSTALVTVDPATQTRMQLIAMERQSRVVQPVWHPPWKLKTVIAGHTGWVYSIAVDPANEWFATGSADRTIKIWDLASGRLKLTLTGHVNDVMAVAVSNRHPYLFSGSKDREVKCWDLEVNKVVRQYHGHLSGVYCVAVHPTIDVLVTGGRDSVARVWDIRTKNQIHVFEGHKSTIASIICQASEPQVITGSHDSTMRTWDLINRKTMAVLTHHKKSIRGLAAHPTEYTFASGSLDNIKIWKCPEAKFLRNLSGHNAMINSLCVNREGVLVSAANNGSMHFWDWGSGYCFQQMETIVQPGSLDSEAGIFSCVFDQTGSRLLTAEADKSIKIWKEDETATPETHPISFQAKKRKRF